MVWSTLKKKINNFPHFSSFSLIFWQMQVTQHELDKKKITYISVTGAKTVWVFSIEAYCTRVSRWACDMIYYSCKCGQKIRGLKKNWAAEAWEWLLDRENGCWGAEIRWWRLKIGSGARKKEGCINVVVLKATHAQGSANLINFS